MLGLTGLGQSALGALAPNGTAPAVYKATVGTTITPAVVGNQAAEYERASRGFRFFQAGVQGPNVAPAPQIRSTFIGRQEQPWHPDPRFWFGVQGPNVGAPVTSALFVRQELPWHPASRLWAGRQQAGNVAPLSTGQISIFVRQEQPWHPKSLLWSSPPPTAKASLQGALNTRQEMPWHPRPYLAAGTPPIQYEDVQVFFIL